MQEKAQRLVDNCETAELSSSHNPIFKNINWRDVLHDEARSILELSKAGKRADVRHAMGNFQAKLHIARDTAAISPAQFAVLDECAAELMKEVAK